jgi:hypothetical protein
MIIVWSCFSAIVTTRKQARPEKPAQARETALRPIRTFISAFAILAASAYLPMFPAMAQQDIRTEEVRFPAGASGTTIKGTITGRESVSYVLGAKARQTMTVALDSANTSIYFNVYAPGKGPGDEALAVSEITGPMVPDMNRFEGVLPADGNYIISVYLYRNAARAGQKADYSLSIGIGGKAASAAPSAKPKGDFADSLSGGPDFWEVTGVATNDTLNMRAEPTGKAQVLARFANGVILANRGCRETSGQRWCRVAIPQTGEEGWVFGRYLREGPADPFGTGSGGGSANSEQDALVPGTDFNATGEIPCARNAGQPLGMCPFGVKRNGGGNGWVTVSWPDGGSRTIYFEKGRPSSYDQSQADGDKTLMVGQNADLFIVTIGTERFEIPDAVINGG